MLKHLYFFILSPSFSIRWSYKNGKYEESTKDHCYDVINNLVIRELIFRKTEMCFF